MYRHIRQSPPPTHTHTNARTPPSLSSRTHPRTRALTHSAEEGCSDSLPDSPRIRRHGALRLSWLKVNKPKTNSQKRVQKITAFMSRCLHQSTASGNTVPSQYIAKQPLIMQYRVRTLSNTYRQCGALFVLHQTATGDNVFVLHQTATGDKVFVIHQTAIGNEVFVLHQTATCNEVPFLYFIKHLLAMRCHVRTLPNSHW